VCIGIDELSRRKGHVYVTNVYGLEGKHLIWSGEGRGQDTLRAFFQEHGEALKQGIDGVCCDMWQPYIDMVKAHWPDATLVFDHLHIMQQLLRAVDEVRREEARALKKTNPELLKRTRHLWLKNPERLTDKQRARLGHLETLNLRCNRAYLLKEAFREFFNHRHKGWARRFLKKWFWWATHSRLKPLRDFAWTLRRHEEDILNYFQLRIDNGAVEGMSHKAKVVSHRCYGFRTPHNYITALYHCLGKLPEPELTHRFFEEPEDFILTSRFNDIAAQEEVFFTELLNGFPFPESVCVSAHTKSSRGTGGALAGVPYPPMQDHVRAAAVERSDMTVPWKNETAGCSVSRQKVPA